MKLIKKKIVFSGGKGRFGKIFQQTKNSYKIFYPTKSELDVTKINTIRSYLKKIKPKYFIHCAALSRPMKIHYQDIKKSIDINIIGTCNVVKICQEYKIKLIFFSTNYVYPGFKGNYLEKNPLLPFNNYGWSKLGGESAVRMYSNSLILRICMTEKPFVHKHAFTDLKTNFMFHDQLSKNLLNLIDKKGILNIGGKIQTVYHFAKKFNKNIKKMSAKKLYGKKYPLNQSMNVRKYINIKKTIKN
ncbi:sugar nucleotide-binding protein [Pelagibacteraceae bacterium]|nr:sugar nucleotide-binding protein [Candidatus Pelagibacter sp.]MDC1485617.1 sugar nucleotide-binding protein [Pelagibacteraceae bacterium]